jgi:DNA-directed RNA polymerase specialized sigma24 family protein
VKLSDDEAKWAMKVALDQSKRFGPSSLGYEDYAASAVEKLLMQEEPPPNIEAWIRLVVTNMMYDRSKKINVRMPSLRGLEPDQLDAMLFGQRKASLSTQVVNQALLTDLLEDLSEKDQRLLILDAAGMKSKEIAEELGFANAKVAATRIQQVRRKIRKALESEVSKEGQ